MPPTVSSAYVTLDSVSFRAPDGRGLIDDLTLTLGRERSGLVGRNGVGKTTLLRLILGQATPAAGSIRVEASLGVLHQALRLPAGASVADLMGVTAALATLRRIEAGVAEGDDLADADWALEGRLAQALVAAGLPDLALDRPAHSLSGGQVTRAALAGLIARQPDLLILDEPTNNLDVEARDGVARLLAGWRGGALVVSHDRQLLRGMDRIVELTSLGARVYGGGYDLYADRKAAEIAAAGRELDAAERAVERTSRDVQALAERKARRDAAGRRYARSGSAPRILLGGMKRRAQETAGRGVLLAARLQAEAAADLAQAQAKVERSQDLAFDLPSTGLARGKTVLELAGIGFAYPGEPPLLADVDLKIVGPERLAVTGPNGAGKTTLIRLAAGELSPTAGEVRAGVTAAFLDQQTALLREDETLLEAYRRLNPGAGENTVHAALARFLFRNVAAEKPVRALSGGERLRAALAMLLTGPTPPQLLILDEPTNHLDLDSIAAVEAALAGYDGALLVVSHDADFLAAIGVEREVRL
jgi:ATPase subunit of ABC transporter with duplicated ATPase domains